MNNIAKKVRATIENAIDKFQPKKKGGAELETYCNFGLQYILNANGCHLLDGLTANEMCKRLREHIGFEQIKIEDAQPLANRGFLVIASSYGEVHGHVAMVCPDDRQLVSSGHWGCPAPWIGNIGKENKIMGANWGFHEKPDFHVFIRNVENPKIPGY